MKLYSLTGFLVHSKHSCLHPLRPEKISVFRRDACTIQTIKNSYLARSYTTCRYHRVGTSDLDRNRIWAF